MSEKDGDVKDFGTVTKTNERSSAPRNAHGRGIVDKSDGDESVTLNMSKTQWSEAGNNIFIGVGRTQKKLPSGVFDINMDGEGRMFFSKKSLSVDDLLDFPDSKAAKILAEMGDFWSKGEKFKEYGFLHRRGYLLYGPAGGGKTCIVQQVIKQIVEKSGTVFICSNPDIFSMGLGVVREIEPDRQIVCIFEDIDAIIKEHGEESLLSLLDGENQINKVLNLATTNYPEDLDRRIIARPRRFDRVIRVGMPEKRVRSLYFFKKLKIEKAELDKWVEATDGFSFASMAELVISVKCLGRSFEESVEILRDLMETKKSSDEDKTSKPGFHIDDDEGQQ